MLCYGWRDCGCLNCEEKNNVPNAYAHVTMVVGEQYRMRVEDVDVRVLCLSLPTLDEVSKERRGHVVVLEENPFVKAGVECRPLANTLRSLL